jgi:signal transduction histidine kinase
MVDGRWLGRAVDELVDNAVKFSPSGGRVTLTAGPAEDERGMVEISVRDSGVGMSPEQAERAFAEWSQGDESDTRSFGGLGLGLALVQRVVEHHGGRVTCTTSQGKGATFSIRLPAIPETDDPPTDGKTQGTQRAGENGSAVGPVPAGDGSAT